ncbi:MAG: Tfp pilus assembly protein FimT/FimU, partial [Alphaproteobacteria bacterium]
PWCDKILGTDCASRPRMTGARNANSFGRSMIEMLGVLAIIGVLSVGGIAGYSKAMEKFKINKATEEYNYMV